MALELELRLFDSKDHSFDILTPFNAMSLSCSHDINFPSLSKVLPPQTTLHLFSLPSSPISQNVLLSTYNRITWGDLLKSHFPGSHPGL